MIDAPVEVQQDQLWMVLMILFQLFCPTTGWQLEMLDTIPIRSDTCRNLFILGLAKASLMIQI